MPTLLRPCFFGVCCALLALLVPCAARAEVSPIEPGSPVRVELRSGLVLHGILVEEGDDQIVLELAEGDRVPLATSGIVGLREEPLPPLEEPAAKPRARIPDPNRTRYLYAPSAMMLEPGEGYVSQKALIATMVAVGLTPNLSVVAGAVVPLWFLPHSTGKNLMLGAQLGAPVSETVHLAVGFQLGASTPIAMHLEPGGIALPYGTLTWGSRDLHASVTVSKPVYFDFRPRPWVDTSLLVVLAANARVSDSFALVAESWLSPRFSAFETELSGLGSLGLRYLSRHVSVDVGMVVLPQRLSFPLPWVDLTFHWGGQGSNT